MRKFEGHPKLLHKFTRNQQNAKVIVFIGLITDGSKTTSDFKTADILCSYLRSVIKPDTGNKLPDLNSEVFLLSQLFTSA